MPELPDVEIFKRALARRALRKKITHVTVTDPRILGKLPAATLSHRLVGRQLVSARRHGKYLLAKIGDNGWLTLHFGLTGGLQFFKNPAERPPYTRVCLDLVGGGHLAYTNKRMIGRVGLIDDASAFIAEEKLGPDALDRRLTFAAFREAIAGVRRDVKSLLMDQQIIAGVGNIYSDEILFQARINPRTRIDKLDPPRLNRLYRTIRAVLKTAITRGAGSEQFAERMPSNALLPMRRKGGRCPRCGRPLQIMKTGGRTTYFCAHCQH